jgi:hypothetical protein
LTPRGRMRGAKRRTGVSSGATARPSAYWRAEVTKV